MDIIIKLYIVLLHVITCIACWSNNSSWYKPKLCDLARASCIECSLNSTSSLYNVVTYNPLLESFDAFQVNRLVQSVRVPERNSSQVRRRLYYRYTAGRELHCNGNLLWLDQLQHVVPDWLHSESHTPGTTIRMQQQRVVLQRIVCLQSW